MKSKSVSRYYQREKIFPEGPEHSPANIIELHWEVAMFIPEETRSDVSYILDMGRSYIQLDFCCN